MYTEKQKNGLVSESLVATELLSHNIPFCIPYGSFDEFDFVVKTSSGFKSIQVKTCFWDNSKSRYIVSLCTTHRKGGESLSNKKYTTESFDFLVAVCHSPRAFYIIPVHEIAGKRSITLYPSGVPDSSLENVRYKNMNNLESYAGRWELLL